MNENQTSNSGFAHPLRSASDCLEIVGHARLVGAIAEYVFSVVITRLVRVTLVVVGCNLLLSAFRDAVRV